MMFNDIYRGKRVLVTGHTGFKGSWLCAWLLQMGAQVAGLAKPPETDPNHFDLLQLDVSSEFGDICDQQCVQETLDRYRPEIIFHLAAQPLVRRSYREPVETFRTNVMGTLNLLLACRDISELKVFVNVTSDKVYENHESEDGYEETARLGGHDPYSCSKACVELLTDCVRRSYFSDSRQREQLLLSTVRAGNVIGGGDWAEDRLIPDAVVSAAKRRPLLIRNPHSIRPWQHVLEPLSGYLMVGQRLLQGEIGAARPWNFGPDHESQIPVQQMIREMQSHWPELAVDEAESPAGPKETKVLALNSKQVQAQLGWKPTWSWRESVARTTCWYREYYCRKKVLTSEDFSAYFATARKQRQVWLGA